MDGFGSLNKHPRMRILELGRLVMRRVVMWEPVSSEDLGQRDLECWVSEAGANSQLREKGNILSNVLDSGRK